MTQDLSSTKCSWKSTWFWVLFDVFWSIFMTCKAFCTEAFWRGTPFCRNQISKNHALCRANTENNNSICTSLMSKCSSYISTGIVLQHLNLDRNLKPLKITGFKYLPHCFDESELKAGWHGTNCGQNSCGWYCCRCKRRLSAIWSLSVMIILGRASSSDSGLDWLGKGHSQLKNKQVIYHCALDFRSFEWLKHVETQYGHSMQQHLWKEKKRGNAAAAETGKQKVKAQRHTDHVAWKNMRQTSVPPGSAQQYRLWADRISRGLARRRPHGWERELTRAPLGLRCRWLALKIHANSNSVSINQSINCWRTTAVSL